MQMMIMTMIITVMWWDDDNVILNVINDVFDDDKVVYNRPCARYVSMHGRRDPESDRSPEGNRDLG